MASCIHTVPKEKFRPCGEQRVIGCKQRPLRWFRDRNCGNDFGRSCFFQQRFDSRNIRRVLYIYMRRLMVAHRKRTRCSAVNQLPRGLLLDFQKSGAPQDSIDVDRAAEILRRRA